MHAADGNVLPCAYVYAVSTDPAHQGNGYASALMRRFAMDADASGRVLYTLPAEASLYKWYQAVMGTTQTARGERIRIARQQTAGTLPNVTRISAPEYAVLRAQQLQGRAYAEPSAALLDFQADLCAMCGGALVHVGCGCAVVERDGDTLIIKELLGADTASAAQALLAAFDAQAAQVCLQRQDGAQPMAAYRPFFRDTADIFWGLYLD